MTKDTMTEERTEDFKISFKSIGELGGFEFIVPAYQRGYCWDKEETETLLNDLKNFYEQVNQDDEKSGEESKEIYCMQPLCVKQDEEDEKTYLVVDGQQRLTTISILMGYPSGEASDHYTLEYVAREGSADYLSNIWNPDEAENHAKQAGNAPDYWHMHNVKGCIEKWFDKNIEIEDEAFLSFIKERVRFIWYVIPSNGDAIAVFRRLNIGRIALTDSELVKALLLHDDNFKGDDSDLAKIAGEWDRIEYRLQDDRFWMFFHEEGYTRPTRIDFLLDLVREMNTEEDEGKETAFANKRYPTFEFFFSRRDELLLYWEEEVKKYYKLLEEWYNDELLYHYMGFLCAVQDDKSDLERIKEYVRRWEEKANKKEFLESLQDDIEKEIFKKTIKNRILEEKKKGVCTIDDYLDFEYEKGGKKKKIAKTNARSLLLFHNVQTIIDRNECIKNEKKYNLPDFDRFPFHLYKKEHWDIEHIRPNNYEDYIGEGKRSLRRKYVYVLRTSLAMFDEVSEAYDKKAKDALRDHERDYVNDVMQKIKDYEILYKIAYVKKGTDQDKEKETDKFVELFDLVSNEGSNSEESMIIQENEKNMIWNYTLLDASTNREYGNNCFYVKRDFIRKKTKGKKPRIKVNDKGEVKDEPEDETAFVPVCTELVFYKGYTDYPFNMNEWTKKDAEGYRKDIRDRLEWLFKQKKKNKRSGKSKEVIA